MKRPGVTLIELLVTLTVSAILLAIFIPAFRTFEEKNNLTQAAQQMRNALFRSQGFALAPRQGSININCYSITLSTTAAEYDVVEVTNADPQTGSVCGQIGTGTVAVIDRNFFTPSVRLISISDCILGVTSCQFQFGVGEVVTYGMLCDQALTGNEITLQLRNSRLNESSDPQAAPELDRFLTFNRVTRTVTIGEE